jgi:hypothetical protein
MQDLLVLDKYGFLNDEPIDGERTVTALAATRKRLWSKLGKIREQWHIWCFYLHVEAIGMRGDQTAKREYCVWHDDWGTEATGRMAGTNAAVGASLFISQSRTGGDGLVDPEIYFDSDTYLSKLQKRDGIHVEWNDSLIMQEPLQRVA